MQGRLRSKIRGLVTSLLPLLLHRLDFFGGDPKKWKQEVSSDEKYAVALLLPLESSAQLRANNHDSWSEENVAPPTTKPTFISQARKVFLSVRKSLWRSQLDICLTRVYSTSSDVSSVKSLYCRVKYRIASMVSSTVQLKRIGRHTVVALSRRAEDRFLNVVLSCRSTVLVRIRFRKSFTVIIQIQQT